MKIDLDYVPHKHQEMLHNNTSRYKVVVAGRRFGKSVFARYEVLYKALFGETGLYWIVNPTYRQGKQIHWHELKKEIPREMISYKNEQELSIHLVNGSRIEIKGADNEDSLRGIGLKGVVLDEAADQKEKTWWEIIRPTLLDSEGWAVFIGTPKGFNWFYELYLMGQKGTKSYDDEWKSYHFTSYQNPYLKKKEIEKAKKATDEDVFAQEYMAEFKRYKFSIYSMFERKTHVIDPFDIPFYGDWEIYRGIDFGYGAEPTVCLWVAVSSDNERWYIIDEYYEIKDTSDYHCGIILAKSAQYPSAVNSYGDPANPQIMQDWAKRGVYVTPASREGNTNLTEWVKTGIGIIQEKMKISAVDHKPSLFVFKHCESLIREIEAYRWKEESDGTTRRPEKLYDHGPDALRYFALSYRGRQRVHLPEDKKDWSFT
jgi:phage terminase large subunit